MNPILPWYVAGPLIGLIVPLLLLLREKQFGISSSYRYVLSGPFKRVSYFNYDAKKDSWQLHFCIGLIVSGLVVTYFIPSWKPEGRALEGGSTWQEIAVSVYEWKNCIQFFIGGLLVGFGARYANGCTAGHCIMGVSQWATSSLVATVSFFVGGWLASNFLIELIF